MEMRAGAQHSGCAMVGTIAAAAAGDVCSGHCDPRLG